MVMNLLKANINCYLSSMGFAEMGVIKIVGNTLFIRVGLEPTPASVYVFRSKGQVQNLPDTAHKKNPSLLIAPC